MICLVYRVINNRFIFYVLFPSLLFRAVQVNAQLSPGELTRAHAHLEGLSNCTKCHILGEKETTSKCLECHMEIQGLINQKKGYHASSEVTGKKCAECHGEHFGRDFKIIRFNENEFNHRLSGYSLVGKHGMIKCGDCHKSGYIKNGISQKKGFTYLGLGTQCLSCHNDYHQSTLSSDCSGCHNEDAFRPASGFNHSKTSFPLKGKHLKAGCEKCHKITERNGMRFQEFAGIAFANCTNCHADVHQNKFGNDCLKCHDEFSFHNLKSTNTFNHDRTDFPLRGNHRFVDCSKCHTGSLTAPLKHGRCNDCHRDYHENQFLKNGRSPDCSECHSLDGFKPSQVTVEKHRQFDFPLEGAHLATPCFMCHQTENKWKFTNLGTGCINCHQNIHAGFMDRKYIPEDDCRRCHSVSVWNDIAFDHATTSFALEGRHNQISCRNCHFRGSVEMKTVQQFRWKDTGCTNCHQDIHFGQFVENGINDCERCHVFTGWNPDKFSHDSARFRLDGKHEGLACIKCHKPNDDLIRNYIVYKFKDISCASCH